MKSIWQAFRGLPGYVQWIIGVVVLIVVVGAATGGEKKSKTNTKDKDTNGKAASGQTVADGSRPFLACLKRSNVRIVKSGKVKVKGRIPRVKVPAIYLGAAVLPHGGVFDLWLADGSVDAKQTAKTLNDALAAKLGVAEAEGAGAQRSVVSALATGKQVGDSSDAEALDRCSVKTAVKPLDKETKSGPPVEVYREAGLVEWRHFIRLRATADASKTGATLKKLQPDIKKSKASQDSDHTAIGTAYVEVESGGARGGLFYSGILKVSDQGKWQVLPGSIEEKKPEDVTGY